MADRALVVLRGDSAVPLESVDPALDHVPFVVVDRVEARRPAATRTEPSTVARLAGPVRPEAGHADLVQHGFVPRRAPALSCRDHDRHQRLQR
ncbi:MULTISPECIES: hypothetical protein [unclassified Streptomyces]|uniref:hypothetical protein n=1 Tax=unclassified Streptomyces TaxID=2593676 RepID=UPI000A3DB9A6|nr:MULTISPECIES: hypothetical protein [unclassified Streptomyces]